MRAFISLVLVTLHGNTEKYCIDTLAYIRKVYLDYC